MLEAAFPGVVKLRGCRWGLLQDTSFSNIIMESGILLFLSIKNNQY